MKTDDYARLRRAERMMVRRMSGVASKDSKYGEELLSHVGI